MDPTELYDRAAAGLLERLPAIDDDQWDEPTPCEGWSVRDLAAHLAEEDCWAAGVLAGEDPEAITERCGKDLLGEDPTASLSALVAEARTAAAKADATEGTVDFGGGYTMPTGEFLTELFTDHLVHTWDLATAVDADTKLDPQLVQACAAWFDDHEQEWRENGEIGPPAPVAEDAGPQQRLLARFGRA